jgi:DNA mismatch endonuclease (patch repair protein)
MDCPIGGNQIFDSNLMSDFLTKKERSKRMSLIRSRGNKKTEVALARFLRRNGIKGWRRNQRLFGKPDFTFARARLVIFVDGCFWHACPSHSRHAAKSGIYWQEKLTANQGRDRIVTRVWQNAGWRVLRIWEHELSRKNELKLLNKINRALT